MSWGSFAAGLAVGAVTGCVVSFLLRMKVVARAIIELLDEAERRGKVRWNR